MPIDPISGIWSPRLSPKQKEVYDCNARYILVSGPRLAGKTTGALARVIRHAWEVDGARFAVFTKFKSTALSGVWPDLIRHLKHEWIEENVESPYSEIAFTTSPRELGSIRMQYFKIRNYWGGESEVQLHSLDYDDDLEEKLFSTNYSGFYFSELQHFTSEDIFKKAIQQLRMPGVPYEKHLWIADTNPPRSSVDHFAYAIWFVERIQKDHIDPAFQNNLALIQFTLDDAIYADPKMIADLRAAYRHDPEAWARFIEGKWTRTEGHGDKHFSILFRREAHVAGDASDPEEKNWELLNPSKETSELMAGWDLGKINHAMVIVQKRVVETPAKDGNPATAVTHWDVLDELVSVGEKVKVEEFTEIALEKIEKLEKLVGHPVSWRHWTDTSAYNWDGGGIDDYDYLMVENVSRGKIRFTPATRAKAPRTVRKRVEKFKSLLGEERILISAGCQNVIEMFQNLRKGRKELDFVARGQPYKHTFDALSYVIYSEMFEDLEDDSATDAVVGARLVSLGAE